MKILVVRRDNIGDLVCTTPLLQALRSRYRDAWIGALVNSYNAPVLDGHPALDDVIAYTKLKHVPQGGSALRALSARIGDLWRLRRMRLDLVLLATPELVPRTIRLARFLAPRRTLGFGSGTSLERALSTVIPVASVQGLHEAERVFALARALGIEGEVPPLHIAAPAAERSRALAAWPAGDGPRLAVHISARRPAQRWPAARFAELITLAADRLGARPMLLWSPGGAEDRLHPGDDDKAEAIAAALPAGVPLVRYPTRTLAALVGALASAEVVLCSDGGAMHVAAALGKPIVAFFGDSPVERWRPWRVPHRLVQPASRRVEDATAEEVLGALSALLGRS